MVKILILVLLLFLAADGIFRDGHLIELFLSQEWHLPFFVRIAYIVIAVVASLMLFHAIIWEFFLMPKPEEKKTELQLKREEEQRAIEEAEEALRLEEEKMKALEEKAKKEEEDIVSNEGRKYLL